MRTYRRLQCLPVVERLLRLQIVAAVAVVVGIEGQIVAVVEVVARRETSTHMVAMVAINQTNANTPFTRVRTYFLNRRIVYLCNPFTRNSANCFTVSC